MSFKLVMSQICITKLGATTRELSLGILLDI